LSKLDLILYRGVDKQGINDRNPHSVAAVTVVMVEVIFINGESQNKSLTRGGY